jgi:hypothetical protein
LGRSPGCLSADPLCSRRRNWLGHLVGFHR